MSNKAVAPSGIVTNSYAYRNFQGIDTSRDDEALENPEQQPLLGLVNGYCDWRGQITRDCGATHIDGGNQKIRHIDFYSDDIRVWVWENEYSLSIKSTNGVTLDDVWPASASVASANFNRRVYLCSAGWPMLVFTGAQIAVASTRVLPGFAVSLSQRLAVAGDPRTPTRVDLSRVNAPTIFEGDEAAGTTDVTRGSAIDIANIIGSSETIRGLGVFENNRLAIFTDDRVLLYLIDPDLTEWRIDDRAQINVGCVSHNTIQRAAGDLFFCARDGVYSMRRNTENGVMVFSVPMSERITLLYRRLLRETPEDDWKKITSVFDHDERQYHVFFPRPGGTHARLTLTLSAAEPDNYKWSTGTFLGARCGAHLGGTVVFGTNGGIFALHDPEDETAEHYPDLVIRTPILWMGSIRDIKQSHSILLQADGEGELLVKACDETGKFVSSFTVQLTRSRDDFFPTLPLNRQHDRRFEHRFRGLQFEFTFSGRGLFRMVGFGVNVRQEK